MAVEECVAVGCEAPAKWAVVVPGLPGERPICEGHTIALRITSRRPLTAKREAERVRLRDQPERLMKLEDWVATDEEVDALVAEARARAGRRA